MRPVADRESRGIARGDCSSTRRFFCLNQMPLNRFTPPAKHVLQLRFQYRFIMRRFGCSDVKHEAQHGQIAALDFQAPIEQLGAFGLC